MSDERADLMRPLLRAIRADVADLKADVRETKHRLTRLEIAVANLAATQANHYASLATRADRTDDRLARIELRLGLAEAEHSA